MKLNYFVYVPREEVVAELVSEDETTVTIKNGLVVFPNQNQTVGFAPNLVPDKSNPELNVNRQHIVYITDVDPGVKKESTMKSTEAKLVSPEEKKLII